MTFGIRTSVHWRLLRLTSVTCLRFIRAKFVYPQQTFTMRPQSSDSKPPNVLLYCPGYEFEDIKSVLVQTLNDTKYTLYQATDKTFKSTPWDENCRLLILIGDITYLEKIEIYRFVHDYYNAGGSILSVCSGFTDYFLRNKEWTSFRQRRKLEIEAKDVSNTDGLATKWVGGCSVDCKEDESLKSFEEKSECFEVICTAGMGKTPVILMTKESGAGRAVFSLINLLHQPDEKLVPAECKEFLKESEETRLRLLKQILADSFDLDCSTVGAPSLTPCYVFANSEDAGRFVSSFKELAIADGQLKSPLVTFNLSDKADKIETVTEASLPLVVLGQKKWKSKDISFDSAAYFDQLKTQLLGKIVLFTRVIPTTMSVIEGLKDFPDVVAVAEIQTRGRGRGGNTWLSPEGCAMFTYPLVFPRDSHLGQKPSFLQHMAVLAMVEGLNTFPDVEKLDIRIKWPNDIYIGSSKIKIGGLLVKSNLYQNIIHTTIGCGVNVNNAAPTVCVNGLLSAIGAQDVSVERVVAATLNRMEELFNEFQANGPDDLVSRYLDHWMHSDAQVTLPDGKKATVTGLDDFGFLRVRLTEDNGNRVLSLQPDGNSFDMMRNLIIIKHS